MLNDEQLEAAKILRALVNRINRTLDSSEPDFVTLIEQVRQSASLAAATGAGKEKQ